LTPKEPTKLLDWMTFLGLRTGMLAKRLGLSHSAIDVAGIKGCRGSRWLPTLSQLIHVPVEILLDTSPEDPAAGEYRVVALLRAADIRMRQYRFEPPSSPLATRHQTGRDAPASKRGASKHRIGASQSPAHPASEADRHSQTFGKGSSPASLRDADGETFTKMVRSPSGNRGIHFGKFLSR